MRLSSIFVALLFSAVLQPRAQASEDLLVFVGRLVEIAKAPEPCPASQEEVKEIEDEEEEYDEAAPLKLDCISFDAVFHATYDVIEVLVGTTEQQRVTFSIADHYGFPGFAEFKHALLFVGVSEEESWLHKYQGYAVHRTVSGRWASCGNPYDDRVGDAPRHLAPVSFINALGSVGESSTQGVMRRFDERYVSIDGDEIICRLGVYVEDLYSLAREGVFAARGVQMPDISVGEL